MVSLLGSLGNRNEALVDTRTPTRRVIPLMNLRTSLKESGFDEWDSVSGIVRNAKKIEGAIGDMILYSDGSLKKGYNPDLVREKGCFNISEGDTKRFYWGDGEGFFNSDPYFVENGRVLIAHQMVDSVTYQPKGSMSRFSMFDKPIFNLSGLYKNHDIKQEVGFFNSRENIEGKIEFLESFLDRRDKSGFKPKDMLVKNPKLRLKLLEGHYQRNANLYALHRFSLD